MVSSFDPVIREDDVLVRPASRRDCRSIAELFLIASDGLAEYIWRQSGPGQASPLDIGEQRYAREDALFSYRNCLIADVHGSVAGMLHSFPMQPPSGREAEPPDPVLRPYTELEDYGSLYISGIAVFPAYRGLGIGSRLLAEAHAAARRSGHPRVSLICFENNHGAMRLYRRLGYREIDRRPLVPHPSLRYRDGDAVLLALQF